MSTTTLDPIRVQLPKGGQYAADRNDNGTWNVRDVICFVEHGQYDRAWCETAVARARDRRLGGYVGPLHVRHHDVFNTSSAVEAAAVEAAGLFAPNRVAEIDFEGRRKAAVYADWLNVPESIYQRIKSVQLPFRSVEILRGSAELDSCALLDHEPPRFRLPITTIGRETFAARTGDSAIFVFRAQEETYMDAPAKDASGAQHAPPVGNAAPAPGAPAPAAAPAAVDVNALAAALGPIIAQAVSGAMVAVNAGKVKPEAGDPATSDGVEPAEQGEKAKTEEPALAAFKAAAARQHKDLSDRVAASEKFAAALVAEKTTEKAVRSATLRLEKAGHKVDEAYEGELRAKAGLGLGVLEEHVATREKFSAVEPPVWGAAPAPRRAKVQPEIEAFRAQGPEVFAAAQEAATEYGRMPAAQRESLTLADFLKYSARPSLGVAVNGAVHGGEN